MWTRHIQRAFSPLCALSLVATGWGLSRIGVAGPSIALTVVLQLILLERFVKQYVQALLSDLDYCHRSGKPPFAPDVVLSSRRWLRRRRTPKAYATIRPLAEMETEDHDVVSTLRVIQFDHLLRTGRSLRFSAREEALNEVERLLLVFDHKPSDPELLADGVMQITTEQLTEITGLRTALLDDLVVALEDPLHFAHLQAEYFIEKITHAMFFWKPRRKLVDWWKTNRTRLAERSPFVELAIVLFQKGQYRIGLQLLERIESEFMPDDMQIALMRTGRLLSFSEDIQKYGVSPRTFQDHFTEIVYCLTEPIRLLRFDSMYIDRSSNALARVEYLLGQRKRVVNELRALWKHEPERLNQPVKAAMEMLTGKQFSNIHARYHFEVWWKRNRARFNDAFLETAKGLRALWEHDLETARGAFKEARRLDPRLRTPLYNLCQVHLDAGRPIKAIMLAKKLAKIDSSDPEAYVMLAHVCRSTGKHQEAIEHMKRAASLGADSFEVHYHLGMIHGELGEADPCVHHLSRAARRVPRKHVFYEELALQFEEMGHYHIAQALHELRQEEAWDPNVEWNADDDGGMLSSE